MNVCVGCGKTEVLMEREEVVLCGDCVAVGKEGCNKAIAEMEAIKPPLKDRLIASIEGTLDELEDIFEGGTHADESIAPIKSKIMSLTNQFEIQVEVARSYYLSDGELPLVEDIAIKFYTKLKEIKEFFEI